MISEVQTNFDSTLSPFGFRRRSPLPVPRPEEMNRYGLAKMGVAMFMSDVVRHSCFQWSFPSRGDRPMMARPPKKTTSRIPPTVMAMGEE